MRDGRRWSQIHLYEIEALGKNMTDAQKRQLETALWAIANDLRGKMDADEFRDYILGFIFFKYLSERMERYADEMLRADGIRFQDLREGSADGEEILDAIRVEAVDELGYFLRPSELFAAVAAKGARKGDNFILEDLNRILVNIQRSTMGTDSEEDFDHLFEDMDLGSTKLGRTVSDRNTLVTRILGRLNDDRIDFRLDEAESDVLGDAYEYLIAQFASGAGKKAGEFYTPQQVSTVVARIVTSGKTRLQSVYDPTCGSGSLLLRVAREVGIRNIAEGFFGQELNRTTYNLARMNMILHGVNYRKFDLKQEDTLEKAIEIIEVEPRSMVAGLHTILARPRQDALALGFAAYLFQSAPLRRQIRRVAQGISVLGLGKSHLAKLEISIPTPPEQTRIAELLGALDQKIDGVRAQADQLQTFKAGLLQKMFV
jgi:type I restriction system adenine methylase HsdM